MIALYGSCGDMVCFSATVFTAESRKLIHANPPPFLLLCIFLGNFSRSNGALELLCCLQSARHAGPGLAFSSLPLAATSKSLENDRQSCGAQNGSLAANILMSFRLKN